MQRHCCYAFRHEFFLQDGRYDTSSDVYQIGRMLHTFSSFMWMPGQFNEVVKRMLQKSITAEQAAQMLP